MQIIPLPTPPTTAERLAYTLNDAALVIGLSVATLRRLAKRGELDVIKVSDRTLVPADSLQRLIAQARKAA